MDPISLIKEGRVALGETIKSHPLYDEWHDQRSAKWDQIDIPVLSAANWGGQGIHPVFIFICYQIDYTGLFSQSNRR